MVYLIILQPNSQASRGKMRSAVPFDNMGADRKKNNRASHPIALRSQCVPGVIAAGTYFIRGVRRGGVHATTAALLMHAHYVFDVMLVREFDP